MLAFVRISCQRKLLLPGGRQAVLAVALVGDGSLHASISLTLSNR